MAYDCFTPHVLSDNGSMQHGAGARFITNFSLKIKIPLKHHVFVTPFVVTKSQKILQYVQNFDVINSMISG